MVVALAAAASTSSLISSFLWASNCKRSLFYHRTLVRKFTSSLHASFKSHHQDLSFWNWNLQSRRCIRCHSTVSSQLDSFPYASLSNGKFEILEISAGEYSKYIGTITGRVYQQYTRLLPCPLQNGPPRVEHLVVKEGGPVLDYICNHLDLPPSYVADLIQFGAVYYALVCPKPPPTATPEQIQIYEEVTSPEVLKKRSSIKGKTVREAQKTYRITHSGEFLEAGTYIRVHVHPKRFPRCYEIDWKSRILAVTDNYVVLDKPAGTSVGGTTDNIEESCATFATRALELSSPLMTTHQIDNCAEGCIILARTKDYCSVFHRKIREKKVKKLYLALVSAAVPVGVITHYMRPINMAPRLVSKDSVDRWYKCQLEVIECKKVPWPSAEIREKYCIDDSCWPCQHFAFECKINLLTGRTHQIRAQLAACGAPIVGDTMYMAAAFAEMTDPKLNPFRKCNTESVVHTQPQDVERWIAQYGKEPAFAIGLQACQISWEEEDDDDRHHFYEAGSPWWRR